MKWGALVWIGIIVLILIVVFFVTGGNGRDVDAVMARVRDYKKRYQKERQKVESNG